MKEFQAAEGFIDKWRVREPEMVQVEVFCPASERALFRAVGALQSELVESIFEISDSAVARTKLSWWMQDLESGPGGRHPLTRAIQSSSGEQSLPPHAWRGLLLAALELLESDHRPQRLEDALEELRPFAQAWAVVESGLLGCAGRPDQTAFWLQTQRSLRALHGVFPERSRLPSPWTASPDAERVQRYAGELLAAAPEIDSASLLGVARMLSARKRLERVTVQADVASAFRLSPWTSLRLAWAAARLARRPVSR